MEYFIMPLFAGPSMMPGGSKDGYEAIQKIVEKVAAQVDDGPCVTYIGPGGSGMHHAPHHQQALTFWPEYALLYCVREYDGCMCMRGITAACACDMLRYFAHAGNFVKQVHNGIEYGDMQLISEVGNSWH